MDEQFEFQAIEKTTLDTRIKRVLRALADVNDVDQISAARTQSNEQADDTDSDLVKYLRSAREAADFCYFELAVQRALENGGNLKDVLLAIDNHLMALFPSTAPDIPEEVEILTFLMHYAVHGPVWRVTGGVTLLDAYLDLTVADLQRFVYDQHGSYFPKWIERKVAEYLNLSEEQFHTEKWRLLRAVLAIGDSGVCNAPGVKIVDDILSSLDGPDDAIRGTKNDFRNYFPDHINVPPDAIQHLLQILANDPISPDQFNGTLNSLPIANEQDTLIVDTLVRLTDVILAKYNEAVDSFRTHITAELGNVDDTYINACTTACEAYIFSDTVMEVLNIFYPHYGIHGIAHWFMASPSYGWFLNAIDNPVKVQVQKGKKTVTQTNYITVQSITNGGDNCYPVMYLLTKIGRSGGRIGTLNGQSRGLANKLRDPSGESVKVFTSIETALTAVEARDKTAQKDIGTAQKLLQKSSYLYGDQALALLQATLGLAEQVLVGLQNTLDDAWRNYRNAQQLVLKTNDEIVEDALISTAGFRAPKEKKAVIVATNEASCILDLLMRTYRFQALNHLMYREVHFLDPIIGDTLCELRPAFLMDCDIIIQGVLPNQQNWQGLVRAYNADRSDCPLDEALIQHPLDLCGVQGEPYDYVVMCRALEAVLQAQGASYFPRFLTLCKAMTRATMLVRDTLGTEMGENHAGFIGTKERARRRLEMGTYNIWYTKSRVNMLGDININGVPLAQDCQLLGTTANLLNNCYALHQDGEIPVVPLYQAQLFTMLKAYVLGRPIVVRLKRIHIVRDDLGNESFEVTEGGQTQQVTITNCEYQTVASEVLVFRPNHQTGSFDFVADPDDDLLDMPCMTISAYGLLDLTDQNSWATDPGRQYYFVDEQYYEETPQTYIDFVKTQNIVNLLNVCSANHPPFARNPLTIDDNHVVNENNLVGQFAGINSYAAERQFWIDLKDVRSHNHLIANQFSYLAQLYDPNMTAYDLEGYADIAFGEAYTLYDADALSDFLTFYRLGQETKLGARQFRQYTLTQPTCYVRRRGNMPFYSTHIYCSTLRVERLRNRNDGTGFYTLDPVTSFAPKDEIVNFTYAYLLNELANTRSTQSQQND